MGVPESVRQTLVDRYAIERELGRGGMGVVYLARDLRHNRPVALKVLLPEPAANSGATRFQREIHFAARLQHPHILTVLDSGEAAGHLWFTMPFVRGESLRDRLRRERQLPLDEALRIAREAALALAYAHREGVVHRDIKPENILLTEDGSTLVADFGIARALGADERLTQTGMAIGTPAYMSPEQASGTQCWTRAPTSIRSGPCSTRCSQASHRTRAPPRRPSSSSASPSPCRASGGSGPACRRRSIRPCSGPSPRFRPIAS